MKKIEKKICQTENVSHANMINEWANVLSLSPREERKEKYM